MGWNSGYVRVGVADDQGTPPEPPTPDNELVFWGLSPSQNPTTGQVLAWDSLSTQTANGDYTFSDLDGNYIGIAVPNDFPQPASFTYNGFPVVFAHAQVTLPIDGVLTLYDVYTSPSPSFAASITVSIP